MGKQQPQLELATNKQITEVSCVSNNIFYCPQYLKNRSCFLFIPFYYLDWAATSSNGYWTTAIRRNKDFISTGSMYFKWKLIYLCAQFALNAFLWKISTPPFLYCFFVPVAPSLALKLMQGPTLKDALEQYKHWEQFILNHPVEHCTAKTTGQEVCQSRKFCFIIF